MRRHWILAVIAAFVFGVAAGYALDNSRKQKQDLTGIDHLHKLDERVTLLNDPKALQNEWATTPSG